MRVDKETAKPLVSRGTLLTLCLGQYEQLENSILWPQSTCCSGVASGLLRLWLPGICVETASFFHQTSKGSAGQRASSKERSSSRSDKRMEGGGGQRQKPFRENEKTARRRRKKQQKRE